MKSKIILPLLLVSTIVSAADVDLRDEGLGVEVLMGGVGVARLGSLGSVLSNPSLLTWLPEKAEFISVNKIEFYRTQAVDGSDVDVSPTIVPISAISGQRFGDWAHAFGFISDAQKISSSKNSPEQTYTTDGEDRSIGVVYAIGREVSPSLSLGSSIQLNRSSNEAYVKAFGQEAGSDYLVSQKLNESIWSMASTLGATYAFESWAFGLSTGFNFAKFGHVSSREEYQYFEAMGETTVTNKHDEKTNYRFIGFTKLGFQKLLNHQRIFFDLTSNPTYENEDGNRTSRHYFYNLGVESPLSETFKIYGGLGLSPKRKVENESSIKEHHLVSLGFSRAGKHSLNFLGFSIIRAANGNQDVKRITFGTKFEY